MKIISDIDAIQEILSIRGRFALYAGAGVSAEAGVMMATGICDEIRRRLRAIRFSASATSDEIARWESETLKWQDPAKRYEACIREGFPSQAARVEFFRGILRGKRPSFSHHAAALLMARGYFRQTCVTTNFDKLLESAFVHQAQLECQAIRNDSEVQYWSDSLERCYVIKLHGDYDTNNISNTSDETIIISKDMIETVRRLLRDSGMVVLGSAGQEKSVHSLFDVMGEEVRARSGSLLSFGLLWGVYVGAQRPANITMREIEDLVRDRIERGNVGPDVAAMMERLSGGGFKLFPVWGGGNFLFSLIRATGNKSLQGTADVYLDQRMRLRYLFARKGLPQEAVDRHLSSLSQQRERLDSGPRSPYPEVAYKASPRGDRAEIRVFYGDITKRSHMEADEFNSVRRAIVSPEDTFLSAGGGVALKLLDKAGSVYMLNELAKFAPIDRGSVAVTSGGNLPVHYVFHAASIEIQNDGSYSVSAQDVYSTTKAILETSAALGVRVLWIPLLGAGVASLKPRQSFDGILRAVKEWSGTLVVLIFIYQEKELSRQEVHESLSVSLGSTHSIEAI
jgi:O-acetyl-ADP-ribose deacetylase (regulator of RNase III)